MSQEEAFIQQGGALLIVLIITGGISVAIGFLEYKLKAMLEEQKSIELLDKHLLQKTLQLKTEEPEKPKREFVDHDGDHLEVVEFDKPKRGDFQ